jgi:DNA-binding NarL/FixJ family response regulator
MIYLKGNNEIYLEGLKSMLMKNGYTTDLYAHHFNKSETSILIFHLEDTSNMSSITQFIERFDKVVIVISDIKQSFTIKNIASVKGIITDKCSSDELIKCIQSVQSNQYYESRCSDCVLKKNQLCLNAQYQITHREYELLSLLCKGLTTNKISKQLFVSVNTVNTHKRNLMKKLAIKRTNELILWGIQNKIIENM